MSTVFMPGLELARLFYAEVVRPLLDAEFPGLRHSAALIGWGSEVLGFDSVRSTDHNWGPRLQLFLPDADAETDTETDTGGNATQAVTAMLTARLPAEFRGYPTVFPASEATQESATHWVEVARLREWLTGVLGFDATRPVTLLDWLATPTQALAEVTGGAVFHDGLAANSDASTPIGSAPGTRPPGTRPPGSPMTSEPTAGALTAVRAALAWYPRDVWLYVLACQWQRMAQEEPFPGRCAEAGDDLGSAVVTARLVRDLMRLVLLMERRYPPYSKWLGTAFARAPAASGLAPHLAAALAATTWPDRERALCAAYEAAARLHNAIAVTPDVDPMVRPRFYDRPYRVLDAGRFVTALREQIADEQVRRLPLTGAVDQFIDSTDAIGEHAMLRDAAAAQLRA